MKIVDKETKIIQAERDAIIESLKSENPVRQNILSHDIFVDG